MFKKAHTSVTIRCPQTFGYIGCVRMSEKNLLGIAVAKFPPRLNQINCLYMTVAYFNPDVNALLPK